MTPTRELALQIYRECKKFCKPLNLRVVCVYGGTGISEQVSPPQAPYPTPHWCFLSTYPSNIWPTHPSPAISRIYDSLSLCMHCTRSRIFPTHTQYDLPFPATICSIVE